MQGPLPLTPTEEPNNKDLIYIKGRSTIFPVERDFAYVERHKIWINEVPQEVVVKPEHVVAWKMLTTITLDASFHVLKGDNPLVALRLPGVLIDFRGRVDDRFIIILLDGRTFATGHVNVF